MDEWCRSKGCLFPRVDIVDSIPGFGGGVVAKEAIPPGIDVVVVPLSLLMNVHSARKAPFWPVCEAMGVEFLSDHEVVMTHLVYERNNPASFWRPYIDSLGVPDVPLLAAPPVLACIKGTSMHLELTRTQKSLARLAERLRPVAVGRPDLGPCGLPELQWAFGVYASRALTVLWTDDEQCGSLVPLADLLNHSGGARVEFLTHKETQQFSIRSLSGTPAGEQVWLNYGCRSEEKMLLNYGFTERGTPFFVRSLCLRAALSRDDPEYDEKMAALERAKLSLEMHVLEDADTAQALQVCRVLCGGEDTFAALNVLRRELARVLHRTTEPRRRGDDLGRLHRELLLYVQSQRDIAQRALANVEAERLAFIRSCEPEVVEAELPFRSKFLTGGRFARAADGSCCIVLTGDAPFRLCIPQSELIEIPSEAEEEEIVAGLPESEVLTLLRSFASDNFPALVFASCGLDDEDGSGEFYLAPVPCIPAYPTPAFTADDVVWTLTPEAAAQLRVLVGSEATLKNTCL